MRIVEKRGLAFLLLGILILALASCGSGKTAQGAASGAQEAKTVYKWKLQTWAAAGDSTYTASENLAAIVKDASDGRLIITPYNAGAIIPAGKEFDGVISGSVEAIHGPPTWSIGYFPGAVFFGSTVGGLTANQTRMWLNSDGRALAQKNYAKLGVHYVGALTPHNAEVFLHTKKPINSVADLKGMKLRMGAASLNDIFKRMGAAPVFLPGGEVYEAMQRGIIDGFEYVTPSVNWGLGFHEVSPYMYMSPSRAPTDAQALFINMKVWESMPKDLQRIVTLACDKAADEYYVREVKDDAEALKKFEAYGTKISFVPKDVEDLLYKTAAAYYTEQAKADEAFREIFESVQQWQKVCAQFGIK